MKYKYEVEIKITRNNPYGKLESGYQTNSAKKIIKDLQEIINQLTPQGEEVKK